ncbi:hypothetical protein EDD15DRAFT_2375024 [Pisolithus albus]|nr:hypothetical protein EDD15DRAFT_2375024 [Pisolithus albus]
MTKLPQTIREYKTRGDKPQNLRLEQASLSPPRASEVTVKIRAVSLQYRDLLVAHGRYAGATGDLVPCSDGAGEIVAVGADVKRWKVGDRVCPNFALDHVCGDVTEETKATALGGNIDGVLREYINVPAHSIVRIPDHLSFEEASTLPCAALTAYSALMGPRPLKGGDYVLALGTGGVSTFAAQIALASGANVIVTSSSDEKMEVAKKMGVQHRINYKKTPNWDEEVRKITGGRGVDHVIEVGGPNTLQKSSRAVKDSGWVHIIGFVAGGEQGIPVETAVWNAITFRGMLVGSVMQFEDMNRLLAARNIHPVIDKVFAFEHAINAYTYLESQKHVGKVVIQVSKD